MTQTQRTKVLQIYPDQDPECPREWDNVGTMVCSHRSYNLGDVQTDDVQEYMTEVICHLAPYCEDFVQELENYLDFLADHKNWKPDEVEQERLEVVSDVFDKHFISLPLYLYDHSGITMSCGPFSCPWDSGQVGIIFVERSKAEEEWNSDNKSFPQIRNTGMGDREFASLEELAQFYLRGEVETYDQYLTGQVYGFVLLDENDEEVDSCWGFFGDNYKTNGIAEHVDMSEVKEIHYMESRMEHVMATAEVEVLE